VMDMETDYVNPKKAKAGPVLTMSIIIRLIVSLMS
jgi:hypothetical protein